MSYDIWNISEEEKIKIFDEFSEKIFPIIKEFEDKIPKPVLANCLIFLAKSLMVCWENDYYLILGMLTDMLNGGLEELLENEKQKIKEVR